MKREYVATFAIGARLLGSFRGAMAAAQSRMKRLQTTAVSVGRSILKFGALFSGLFAGIAAFGVGAIFKKMFEGADEAAAAAEQRERKLTAALMTQNRMRKLGRQHAEEQVGEITKATSAMAKQSVFTKGMYDSAAGILALQKIGPKEIVKTLPALADVLVSSQGINASMEDMNALALAFGKGVQTGTVPRSMMKYIGSLTVAEAKELKLKAKQGDRLGAYNFLMERVLKFSGEMAKAVKTPEGRIKLLDNALALMRLHIGRESVASRAAMADAWRGLLPEIEPFIIAAKKMTNDMMASIANFIRVRGVPALKAISAWAKGPGAIAWDRMKKAWNDMAGAIGKALSDQFKNLAGKGKNFGDVVIAAMNKITAGFKWITANAKEIVWIIEGVTAAFIALQAVAFIQGKITVIGAAAALVALAKVRGEFAQTEALLAKKPVEVDPGEFTKHWYLAGQSWREFTINFSEGAYKIQQAWATISDWFVAQWNELIMEGMRLGDALSGIDWTFGFRGMWADAMEEWKQHWAYFQAQIAGRPTWLGGTGKGAGPPPQTPEQIKAQRVSRETAEAQQRTQSVVTSPAYLAAQAAKAAAEQRIEMRSAAMRAADTYTPANRLLAQPEGPKAPRFLAPPEATALAPWQEKVQAVFGAGQQAFDQFLGSTEQMKPALDVTRVAMTDALVPAVSDVTLQFGLLSELLAGLTGLGGVGGAGGGFGGGVGGGGGGPAGAAALAPITSAAANVPLPPEAVANIASERADFIKELQKPEMQNLVSATLSTEMQSAEGQKDVLESLVNRAVAYKRAGKYKGMENMIKGGFYGPYNRGVTNAVMRSGLTPEREKQVAGMIEEVKTRNALRGMTDQGVNVGPRQYVRGEGYSYGHGFGEQYKTAAYLESQKAAAEAAPKMQAGGIVTKPTVAQIGEAGPEAVVPLSKMQRLWQYTKHSFAAPWQDMASDVSSLYNTIKTTGRLPQPEVTPNMKPGALEGLLDAPGRMTAPSHSTSVSFAPTITIHGNASAAEQSALDSKLRDLARDFVADFKRAQTHERRLSYEGGYG